MTSINENLTALVVESRTELGIRRAADALGVNAQTLVDSRMVQSAIGALDVQQIEDLDSAIAEAIKPVIEGDPQHFGIAPAPQAPPETAQPAAEGHRQWTADDVRNASPAETIAAMKGGLLSDLGVGARRKRR